MDEDLTLEEKEALAEMLRQGFELALKMESCITKKHHIPVVMSAWPPKMRRTNSWVAWHAS